MFFWNSLAFSMIQQMLAIWSLVPLPFLNPAWTSESSWVKPDLEKFEHCFASMWDECNCAVVWIFFGIAFLRDWNKNWPFPVLWPLLSFPNLLADNCNRRCDRWYSLIANWLKGARPGGLGGNPRTESAKVEQGYIPHLCVQWSIGYEKKWPPLEKTLRKQDPQRGAKVLI